MSSSEMLDELGCSVFVTALPDLEIHKEDFGSQIAPRQRLSKNEQTASSMTKVWKPKYVFFSWLKERIKQQTKSII